ncbi:hypothetical protein GCM10011343_02330 [Flavobacterium orientale]|uniref:Uncharacterized protein n=2 Tax=Flavobacterium orientale TaxID=1756020 RepID=A0A917D9C8_9FLAO|nr:hypothetical protein GCM10011343_02330 [Flavobacterium orientale]
MTVSVINSSNTTPVLSPTYPSLALALDDINAVTAMSGPVTIILSGSETAPEKGFTIGSLTLNNALSATNTLTFHGAGTATINAGVGTATPGSALPDGMLKLVGADWVTLSAIVFTDSNVANPATMEFGVALFKLNTTDGAQNNTIVNCVFNMQRVNNASGSGPMADGAAAITLVNAVPTAATTALSGLTAASGSNSFNKIYGNTINGGNTGIYMSGFAASSPFTAGDSGNDVGGNSLATGNTVLNFGGGGTTSPAVGIRANNQWGVSIRYNTIDNNNGSGVNHATTLRGIFAQAGTSANATVSNNSVTIRGGGTTTLLTAIDNGIGSTAASNTIDINNNTIRFSYTTATTGVFTAVNNSSSAATVNINNNNIQQLGSTNYPSTGTVPVIAGGSSGGTLNINNNSIANFTMTGASGTLRAITAGTPPTLWNVDGNTIENLSYSTAGSSGSIDGIYNFASAQAIAINNNTIRNFSTPGTGTLQGIYVFTSSGTQKNCNNNAVYNFSTSAGGVGGATMNGIRWAVGPIALSGNQVYNLNSTGSTGGTGGSINGIFVSGGSTNFNTIFKNKIYNLSTTSTNPVVSGILISGGTFGTTVFNNIIGDLQAPAANAANPLNGINVTGGTAVLIHFNTVLLNASSTGTNFGSSAISASTTPTVTLRNNIFVNKSSRNGTGVAAAYRRSSTSLGTYGADSNNNLFFGAAIYFDGTNTDGSLDDFKARVTTRDTNSVTEDPTFVSTSGASGQFLHINTTVGTLIESGGIPIAGVTDDFDGDLRNETTPDIGADEFAGTAASVVEINSVAVAPAVNQCIATSRLVSANITAGAGAISSVTLNYFFNGVEQTPIAMTGGSITPGSTSTFTATIPVASPVNATVTWSVTAVDGVTSKNLGGASYSDEPFFGATAVASASTAAVCSGFSTTLSAFLEIVTNKALGNGGTSSSSVGQSFLPGFWGGAKTQYIIKASELEALGLLPGSITALGFQPTSSGQTYQGFSVSLGYTTQETATTTFVTGGLTQVYSGTEADAGFTPVANVLNTLAFGTGAGSASSFEWDGTSNILVSICWSRVPSASTSSASSMLVDNVGFASTNYRQRDSLTPETMCAETSASSTTNFRPRFTFYGTFGIPADSVVWSDGTSTVGSTVSPTTPTTYTATLFIDGCSITTNGVTIGVNPLPAAPTASNSSQCGVKVPTASVADPNGFVSPQFNWYASEDAETPLQTSTATTFAGAIDATTTFYVSVVNPTTLCESARVAVTVTVVQPTPLTLNPAAGVTCVGQPIVLSASSTNLAYNYTWTVSPQAGSGVLGTLFGPSQSITPTASGTYVFTVTAADASCTIIEEITVQVNGLPVLNDVTTNDSSLCENQIATLNAVVPTILTFNTGTGAALVPMSGATQVIGSSVDDTVTPSDIAIGFDFVFNGEVYSQCRISPDGWIRLGGGTASNQFSNSVTSTTNIPKLYPYWDDLATGTTGNVSTLVVGTAPNRIFVVEWFVTVPRVLAGDANSTFQALLYEGTNRVEYRYGAMGPATGQSASVGYTIDASTYSSITLTTNETSTTVANNSNAIVPEAGRFFTFDTVQNNITWTPLTDLYSDSAATVPYAGEATNLVYAKLTTDRTFTARLTDGNGCFSEDSVALTYLGEYIAPITGGAATVCLGSPTVVDFDTTSIEASWSSSNPEVATIDPEGVITAISAGTTTIGAFYFNEITGCTSYAANPQTITVYAPVAFNLGATNGGQPLNASILPGGSTSFSVATTGDVSGYQWFQSTNGVTFSPLANDATFSGVTSATLTVANAPESLNNTYYRCVVYAFSPCAPSIQSEFAFLSVANLSITANPQSTTICSSGLNAGTASFTVAVGGPTDLVVWELFDGSDWLVIDDQGLSFGSVTFGGDVFSTTLLVNGLASLNSGWKVRANALLFDPETIVTSNEATVTVNNQAVVNSSPDNKVVCYSGGVSTFTVVSSGGTGFQWEYSADGATWTNVANATPVGASYSGATTATLTVTTTGAVAPDGLFYYRARVNSPTSCEPAFSQAATLTVNDPQIAITASATSICSPGNEPVKLTASGGATYSWAPSATLSASTGFEVFANPTQTTTYTVTATDATGCVKTATVTVVVYPAVVASIATPTDEVCLGDSVSLNALANVSSAVKDYTFQTESGTYQEVSAGATTIPGVLADTFISTAQPIGFSFYYEGQEYTQFKMSSNGFLSLNMTGTNALTTNNLSTLNSTSRPIIAPLWDDLDGRATGGSVAAYEVTGVAPNRVLTVEWRNFEWNWVSTVPVISFQAKLYESTNIIEFVYRSETGAVNNGSASIGLNSITGSGTGSYINVTDVATAAVSSTTATTNINTKPATGTIYRFAPPSFTYEWSSEPAGFTSNLMSPTVVVSETTTYTVVVTANTGCSDTATKTLTVSSGVTLTEQPLAVGPLCEGVDTSFSVVASGPSLQYQWRKDGLAIAGNASATTATLELNGVLPSQSGAYDVLITPACGEPQLSASQALVVYPTPTLEALVDQDYCSGETAGVTPLSGTPSGVTYDIVGGAAVGLADQFGVTEIPSFAVVVGTATVTVTPKANGCEGTPRSFTITVGQKPSDISLNTYSDAICSIDNGVLLTASGGLDVAATILSQDFNNGLQGWTVTSGATSPTQSNWAIYTAPYSYSTTFSGFSTQNGGGFIKTNSDAGGSGSTTNTVLTSPVFSTVGSTSAVLSFEHLYQVWTSGDTTVRVEISTNGGSTWSSLNSYLGTNVGVITSNNQVTAQSALSLDGYLNEGNLRIRFNYVSTWGYYWILDDIKVIGAGQGAFTWSPIEGLYTDSAATIPYQGEATASVYARPAATQSFVATVNSNNGCSTSSAPSQINVTQATQWYADLDGDGYGDVSNPTNFLSCNAAEPGFSSVPGDCNDNNALINPGVAEICFDGIDNNCDGSLFADCTPIVVSITSNVCGSVNNGLNNTIQSNQVNLGPGYVIGYRFEVTNTETGEVRTIDRNIHHFKLTMFGDDFYNYGTTYTIRVAAIINGEVQPYNGTTCSITTTSVGSTSIVPAQCGSTLATMSSSINAVAVNPTPSKYRFRVARADAPTTFYYVERTVPNFNLTLVAGLPLTFETEYLVSVQIRVKLAGFESWSQWSAASCSVFTPAAPTTAVTEADCEFVATSNTDVIHATPLAGATMYRFLLLGFDFDVNDDMIIVYEQYVDTPNPYFTLDMFTGLIPGVNYSVSVAAELFGTFTPYGKECSVTTPTIAGCIVTTSFGSLTPACTGAVQTISSCTYAGEFNTVTLTAENTYTFSSSIVTDFLTITTTDGVILAAGVQPVVFTPYTSGAYRLHVTTNSSCGTQSSCRTTRVSCLSGVARQIPTEDDSADATLVTVDFKAVGYPNPYVDYFSIAIRSNSTETVRYAIYDMTGRLLETKEVNPSELHNSRLGMAYPSGIYNVIVVQEDQTQTIRMVKK